MVRRSFSRLGDSLSIALILTVCGHAAAIPPTTGRLGSNIEGIRSLNRRNGGDLRLLGWDFNGAGVILGQIEGGRPGDVDLTNGGGGVSELFHQAVDPGGPGLGNIGVAIAGVTCVSGTHHNVSLDGHAESVAGMMNAQNVAMSAWGCAPNARLYSSAFVSTARNPAGGFIQTPMAQWGPNVVASGEWMRQAPAARVINHSYGLTPQASLDAAGNPGVPNGNNLLAFYLDYSTIAADELHVIAGDENTWANLSNQRVPVGGPAGPLPRTDTLIIDAYNPIVVGATQQRAAGGRFDEVSNWSNSNRVTDARGWRTDVVAPGGASFQFTVRPLNAAGTAFTGPARNVNVFPANNQFNEVVTGFAFLGSGLTPSMPTLVESAPGGPNPGDGFFDNADTTGMSMNSVGTSFAAPQVTSLAGLLTEQRPGESHLSLKAAIINSASKHVLSKPADNMINATGAAGQDDLSDTPGQSWTQRYEARYGAIPTSISQSRDPDMGFGQINGLSAVKQNTSAGDSTISVGDATVGAGGNYTANLFVGGETLKPGSLVTATIVWDRIVNTTMNNPNLGQLQMANSYAVQTVVNNTGPGNPEPLADLDLRLVRRSTGQTVAYVLSRNDNVEHLYFNVRDEDNYDLVVDNRSNRNTTFALALSSGTSDGLAFTVDHNSQGKQSPGRGQIGSFANVPNDVNNLGHGGQGDFDIGSEIFASSLNGSNMQRGSGGLGTRSRVGPHLAVPAAQNLLDGSRGVLGLRSGDQLSGLSWGRDGSQVDGQDTPSTITFSVDNNATGAAISDVRAEVLGASAAGDIFKTPQLDPFGSHNAARLVPAPANSNKVHVQESQMGLWAPATGGGTITPGAAADNLRDFEHDNIRSYTDTDGDGMINNSAFFALGRTSPTVVAGGAAPGDILVAMGQDPSAVFGVDAPAGGFSFSVFATTASMGLAAGDGIDGLILSQFTPGTPLAVPFFDEALFSLDPASPSVVGLAADPGAIYFTDFLRPFNPNLSWLLGGSLFASPIDIGLLPGDNIDGLDIWSVPTPSSLVLLALGTFAAGRRRRA